MTSAQIAYQTHERLTIEAEARAKPDEAPREPVTWEALTTDQRDAWTGAISDGRRNDRAALDGDDGARALVAARKNLAEQTRTNANTQRRLVKVEGELHTQKIATRTAENREKQLRRANEPKRKVAGA